MRKSIENEWIKVEIEEKGAQLVSLKSKKHNLDYMWNRNPDYWGDCALNLFPVCGRLEEGRYTYQGKSYSMDIHGFAKDEDFVLEKISDVKIRCILKDNEITREMYPFSFEYVIEYSIEQQTLIQNILVKNTGKDVLPFAVGGHPGFRVPLTSEERFEDYYLEFDSVEALRRIIMSERCFYMGKSEPFSIEEGKIIRLSHEMFDDDAIFLENMSKGICLKSEKSGYKVHISYPDMKYLGIWHTPKTKAPFICIEPWNSLSSHEGKVDDIMQKDNMIKLKSGEEYSNRFTITIE